MPITKHTDSALDNHLLAALPAEELAELQPDLDAVSLHLGQVIYDHEMKRKRTHQPDLSTFKFNYKE